MIRLYRARDRVTAVVQDYRQTFQKLPEGCVVYCDPPYFDTPTVVYNGQVFTNRDQRRLARLAESAECPVILHNHCTDQALSIYRRADIHMVTAPRLASSAAASRGEMTEIIARFNC